MAIILVVEGESNTVRPGDVVFHYDSGAEFSLHAGVFVGEKQRYPRRKGRLRYRLRVSGVPGHLGRNRLDLADWGAPREYRADVIGRRLDVNEANVRQVALLSQAVLTEHTQLGTRCSWDKNARINATLRIRDGIPLFERGTCSQFVEYLYEQSGLDLIQQDETFNPAEPVRIYPACQIYVFWSGKYHLRSPWDKRYERFPNCLIGTRSRRR